MMACWRFDGKMPIALFASDAVSPYVFMFAREFYGILLESYVNECFNRRLMATFAQIHKTIPFSTLQSFCNGRARSRPIGLQPLPLHRAEVVPCSVSLRRGVIVEI